MSDDFPIDRVLETIDAAIADLPKAAMFALAELGHDSLFEQLVGCMISVRTLDEVTLPASLRLFERAADPAAIAALERDELAALLEPARYAGDKATRIKELARWTAAEHPDGIPPDDAVVRAIKGIGPKCANLALGIACGLPRICVDTHVHRVTNRWGYVATKTPLATLAALEQQLPQRWSIDLNRLLVPFGKQICTPRLPKCSSCPVAEPCARVGVERHR